ncbi:MAG TPA: DPP IV N-terminal domain-containing protein [Thermoanaerobaculia bacterium]|jgi:dipeptidyl-peptidase-4|nr:DPP IV N-terminal domain-containing protein [Thermoanaerobaculia bacterium]
MPDKSTTDRLTVEAVMSPTAWGRRTAQREWSPDGERLTYVWDEKGDGKEEALWSLDPETGKKEILVRLADLKQGDEDFRLDAYSWSPRGDALLLVSRGDLYLLPFNPPLDPCKLRRLTHTEAAEEVPSFSPDGSRIAFVREYDLYVLDVLGGTSGQETRLTTDGKENTTLNGINDWVYEEEIWNRAPEGYWWSPDGSRIAYYHFDETPVSSYPLVDDDPTHAGVTWQKYPLPGEANPRVRIGVADIATGHTTWMRTGDDDSYLARVAWTPKGDAVAIQRLNREQNRLDLLRCGPSPANSPADRGACSTLLTETWPTWINLGEDFHFLPDGRFLWGSERGGWRRLYLYSAEGKLIRPVTPEGWAITSLGGVAEDGTWALVSGFSTAGLGAIDRKVARVRLDDSEGNGWEVLTPEPGTHQAGVVSPRSGAWLQTSTTADLPPYGLVRPASGGKPIPMPATAPVYDPASLPKWEFLTIPGPDGSKLPARILKPVGFDPARRYPVIMHQYGGPGSQVVENAWNARAIWYKLMAQRGFAVFMVDNQTSIFFGKAGEDRDHRRMSALNLAAQLAGVDYLKSLPWVDGSRIGLWGWSGGGTNTLYCILNRPGVWKAALAGAPVTDWRLYDSIWTERYLDSPKDNPDGYRDSSPLTYSGNLADRLLIVHGLADDNVHPQNTVVMSRDFVKAGRQFDAALYPGQRHAFVGPYMRHFFQRMTDFFERELRGADEMKMGK